MSVFPDIAPLYGYTITPAFKTLMLGPTDGDFIQRRKKRLNPLHMIEMSWRVEEADMQTINDFYMSVFAAYEAFAFFDFNSKNHSDVNIGTADASGTVFDLGAKSTSNQVIKVATVTQPTSGYAIGEGTGTDGQDKVTFGSPPVSGEITASYKGRQYFANCIFSEDGLKITQNSPKFYNVSATIQEVSS